MYQIDRAVSCLFVPQQLFFSLCSFCLSLSPSVRPYIPCHVGIFFFPHIPSNNTSETDILKIYHQKETFTKCKTLWFIGRIKIMIVCLTVKTTYKYMYLIFFFCITLKKKILWFTWVLLQDKSIFLLWCYRDWNLICFDVCLPCLLSLLRFWLSGHFCFLIIVFFVCHIILWTKPVYVWLYPSRKKAGLTLPFSLLFCCTNPLIQTLIILMYLWCFFYSV